MYHAVIVFFQIENIFLFICFINVDHEKGCSLFLMLQQILYYWNTQNTHSQIPEFSMLGN